MQKLQLNPMVEENKNYIWVNKIIRITFFIYPFKPIQYPCILVLISGGYSRKNRYIMHTKLQIFILTCRKNVILYCSNMWNTKGTCKVKWYFYLRSKKKHLHFSSIIKIRIPHMQHLIDLGSYFLLLHYIQWYNNICYTCMWMINNG